MSTSPEELSIEQFQQKVEQLRYLYDQFFLGQVKREPQTELNDLLKLSSRLSQTPITNTSLKFRFRSLVNRLNTYRRYWSRISRQIELGTYKRDVARVRRRLADKGYDMPKLGESPSVAAVEKAIAQALSQTPQKRRPATGPDQDAAATGRRRADSIAGVLDPGNMASVYRRLRKATAMCGGNPDQVSYDRVSSMLMEQYAKLKTKYPKRAISFQVVS